jgi:CheY-like chemotaxis protein
MIPGFILVLEDCDEDFETVCDAARRAGVTHQLHRAKTGDECVEFLRQGDSLPAFVLLDLNTVGGDGRDALRFAKSDPRLRSVPVVVLTTSANPRDLDFCYGGGANAYHVKPVRHDEHLRVLGEIFHYWLRAVALPQKHEVLTRNVNSSPQ